VWLSRALQDISNAPLISLAHGLALILIGAAILTLGHNRFWLMAGALSGFLVVGPLVATSLYAISRAMERGEVADWGLIRRTWTQWQSCHATGRGGYWCMVRFGALLALAATGWVLISASLITVMSPVRADPAGFHCACGAGQGWSAVCAMDGFGQLSGCSDFCVQRGGHAADAGQASDRAPGRVDQLVRGAGQPGPMALWAALIVMLTLLGLGSYLLGLVVVMPLLGHASWHAYRDLVDASAFPARDDAIVPAV
jgi:uncharacterized membrane protein